jgi:hypothetical protein
MGAVVFRTVALVSVVLAVVTAALLGSIVGGVPASADSVSNGNDTDCTDRDDFCATFPEETVAVMDWPYRTNLTVGGNSSAIEITAEELNASQLARIFGGEKTDDGVRVAVGDDRSIPASFEYSGGGNYTFHVRAIGSNRTADAHLKLLVGKAPTVTVTPERLVALPDTTPEIGLDLRDTAVANVTIAGEEFRLTVRVRDADGNGRVGLLVDLAALGRSGTDAVAVAGNDRLLSATLSGANQTLSVGQYEIRVGTGGRETDLGLLEVVPELETTTNTPLPTTVTTETTATETTPTETTTESNAVTAVAETSRRTSQTGRAEVSDDETPPSGVPGFGVVSALVVLVLAYALVRR